MCVRGAAKRIASDGAALEAAALELQLIVERGAHALELAALAELAALFAALASLAGKIVEELAR